ncbi:MAG: hypothetical protein AAB116_24615 [Candidatus Poribacteria bacterium]
MILVDSNIFLIDRFFKRDLHFSENKNFLDKFSQLDVYFSIFSLLELCGIASFNLSPYEIKLWFFDFPNVYNVKILEPSFKRNIFGQDFFDDFLNRLFDEIEKKATLLDALILKEINTYNIHTLVTWNKKHFEHHGNFEVLTPAEFNNRNSQIEKYSSED